MVASLFDEVDDDPSLPDWKEVSQARFLSWSPEMQRAYCVARDLDSAARADDVETAEFFLSRAKSYKETNE